MKNLGINAIPAFLCLLSAHVMAHPGSWMQCSEQYALTQGSYAETADMQSAVAQEFGPGATVADWNEIEADFGNDILSFCDAVGLLTYRSQAWCRRGAQGWWSSGRHYFLERHNGQVPGGWLVHDQIGGNLLDLGSWYGSKRILAKVGDQLPPIIASPPAVLVIDPKVGLPGAFVYFSVTASDTCDASPSLVCTPPPGSYFPRGTTMVTCMATDASGNQATRSFPVIVMPTIRD